VRPAASAQTPLPSAAGYRFVLLVARFNETITFSLRDGARATLREAGANDADVDEFAVPGAFELPQAARCAAETGRYDAVICLGCVIRGETPHFDYVAGECARALQQASAEFETPVSLGVLTCDTTEQALARAGGDHGNKGWDAEMAALEMVDLLDRLDAADSA
jgi:6,7-dimethyl-8-ribityllumazine synthase